MANHDAAHADSSERMLDRSDELHLRLLSFLDAASFYGSSRCDAVFGMCRVSPGTRDGHACLDGAGPACSGSQPDALPAMALAIV